MIKGCGTDHIEVKLQKKFPGRVFLFRNFFTFLTEIPNSGPDFRGGAD